MVNNESTNVRSLNALQTQAKFCQVLQTEERFYTIKALPVFFIVPFVSPLSSTFGQDDLGDFCAFGKDSEELLLPRHLAAPATFSHQLDHMN